MTSLELIQHELGRDDIDSETSLDTLGLDSLEFVDLIQGIEGWTGRPLSPTDVAVSQTVGDLCKLLPENINDHL